MNILTYILYAIVIAIVFFMAYGREKTWVLIFGQADLGPIEFETFTPSKKPNNALFCPPKYCQNAPRNSPSPVFNFSVDQLKTQLFDIIDKQPLMLQVANDDENQQYRFVQYTPLMRYPDTIRIKLIALDEGKSTLAIYSESQIGRGDMNVNYKRINGWMDILEAK